MRIIMACMLIGMLGGCTAPGIVKGGDGPGFDVYRAVPYILVVRQQHKVSASIVYLPDYSTRYRVSARTLVKDAGGGLIIKHGWMLKTSHAGTGATSAGTKITLPNGRGNSPITKHVALYGFYYGKTGRIEGLSKMPSDLPVSYPPPAPGGASSNGCGG